MKAFYVREGRNVYGFHQESDFDYLEVYNRALESSGSIVEFSDADEAWEEFNDLLDRFSDTV